MPPRTPVITEDVVSANRGRKCHSTAKGYNNKKGLNEEKENTAWNLIQSTSNNFCHPAQDDEQKHLLQQ